MPARRASRASASLGPSRPPPALPQTGKFVPEKSNIWRDCVDGFYDWVKEHIEEVGSQKGGRRRGRRRGRLPAQCWCVQL